MRATTEATPNIAFVKYWGKRDERLFLPQNSSISATLDFTLTTRTTVVFGEFAQDKVWLDGKKADDKTLQTVRKVLNLLRVKAKSNEKAHVASVNEFPTAAGLASSASGMAALTLAAVKALGLSLPARELSIIARQGSGSSCRSVLGGFVEWHAGRKADGADSFAEQLFPPQHWQLHDVIAIAAPEKKKVSSRAGMKQTVESSTLYASRLEGIKNTLGKVRLALKERNASLLFESIMRESDNMHACMLDTWPPITYLNDTSRRIMHEIIALNERETKAGYTFDAGPNAHVICEEKNAKEVKRLLEGIEGVQRIIDCGVGEGPKESKRHLLDEDGKVL